MVKAQYTKGLTPSQKKKKIANIKKTKKLYDKGEKSKAFKLAKKRPMTKKGKKSTYTIQFKKMHPGVSAKTSAFTKATGIPMSVQDKIVKRGEAAWATAGSRPSVGSPTQWGIARLYAFYVKIKKGQKLNHDTDLRKGLKIK